MKKISKTTEMFEITTKLYGNRERRIAILNGEIVRILDTGYGGNELYLIREDVDMELFEDTKAERTVSGKVMFWKYYVYDHAWQQVSVIKKMRDSDFKEECYKEIRLMAQHNPQELKNLYGLLKEGEMKEYVKEVQKELLKALDF